MTECCLSIFIRYNINVIKEGLRKIKNSLSHSPFCSQDKKQGAQYKVGVSTPRLYLHCVYIPLPNGLSRNESKPVRNDSLLYSS
jgi:hypothetical protein